MIPELFKMHNKFNLSLIKSNFSNRNIKNESLISLKSKHKKIYESINEDLDDD